MYSTIHYISDGTGFGYGQKYQLKWMRGTVIRTVSPHIRLCAVIGVNERGNAVIAGCETGKAYASEIKMLRSILSRMERFERVPFIADKGYDAVDVIERIKRLGGIPAVGIKQTQRKGVSNDLRKESLEEWERCKKKRYRVEALFGAIKLKVGSGFNLVREDMARKSVLAVAALWSFYMLVGDCPIIILSSPESIQVYSASCEIDTDLVDDCQQQKDKPKRGRPFKCPTTLIVSAPIPTLIFGLFYRQLEGFLKSLTHKH